MGRPPFASWQVGGRWKRRQISSLPPWRSPAAAWVTWSLWFGSGSVDHLAAESAVHPVVECADHPAAGCAVHSVVESVDRLVTESAVHPEAESVGHPESEYVDHHEVESVGQPGVGFAVPQAAEYAGFLATEFVVLELQLQPTEPESVKKKLCQKSIISIAEL